MFRLFLYWTIIVLQLIVFSRIGVSKINWKVPSRSSPGNSMWHSSFTILRSSRALLRKRRTLCAIKLRRRSLQYSWERKEKEMTSNGIMHNLKCLTDQPTDRSNGALLGQGLWVRDGVVVRVLAFHQCDSDSMAALCSCGLSLLLVLALLRGFSPATPVILPPEKPTFQIAIRPGYRTSCKSHRAGVTSSPTITYSLMEGITKL